jgi:ribonuclease Z
VAVLTGSLALTAQAQEKVPVTPGEPAAPATVSAKSTTLPPLAFMGGTKAMALTPVVGKPKRAYAEMFVPGAEALEDGELRVTVLGSGNPFPTRDQASASVLIEVGRKVNQQSNKQEIRA